MDCKSFELLASEILCMYALSKLQIYLTDYLPNNRDALLNWLTGQSSFDWHRPLSYIAVQVCREKVVVLCISLLKCYKELVKDAFCGVETNLCKSLCDNKDFMQAMKFRVTLDGLEMAICTNQWADAQNHIRILKSICCCNGY